MHLAPAETIVNARRNVPVHENKQIGVWLGRLIVEISPGLLTEDPGGDVQNLITTPRLR